MKELSKKTPKARKTIGQKIQRWDKMLKGDDKALIEIMIERGMATKEDFPGFIDDPDDEI